jgi:hypothetical protein
MYSLFNLRFSAARQRNLTSDLVTLNVFYRLGHVSGLLRRRLTCLTAFQTALSTHLKIFRLVSRPHCFSSLSTYFTRFLTSLFFAQLRNIQANLLHVFRVEHGPVCAGKKTDFSCQNACFHVLDSFKNFVSQFLPTYLQMIFLTWQPIRYLATNYVDIHLKLVVSSRHLQNEPAGAVECLALRHPIVIGLTRIFCLWLFVLLQGQARRICR